MRSCDLIAHWPDSSPEEFVRGRKESSAASLRTDTADPKPSLLFGPPSDMKGEAEKLLRQVVSARPQNRLSLEVVN